MFLLPYFLPELQEQVFMPTWRSTTSLIQRPFSTSTISPTTHNLSSPSLRPCILAATGPTTYTTSSACFITKASCFECTRRTLMDWRNVRYQQKKLMNCILGFQGGLKVLFSRLSFLSCSKCPFTDVLQCVESQKTNLLKLMVVLPQLPVTCATPPTLLRRLR